MAAERVREGSPGQNRGWIYLKLVWLLTLVVITLEVVSQSTTCKFSGIFLLDKPNKADIMPSEAVQPSDSASRICPTQGGKSCCNDSHLFRVKNCYDLHMKTNSSYAQAVLRNMSTLISDDFGNQLNTWISQASTVSNRRRRVLQNTNNEYNPMIFIRQFRSLYNYKSTMLGILMNQTNQCWTYYFNKVQRGMMCSLCLTPENSGFMNISSSTLFPTYDLSTCDHFIPNCIQTIDMQVQLSEFFRNFLILQMQNQFNTGEDLKLLDNFMKYYPSMDEFSYVDDCKKRASCDNLCRTVLKFGSFDNPYLFGSLNIYRAMSKIANDSRNKNTSKVNFGETAYKNMIFYDILGLPPLSLDSAAEGNYNITVANKRADAALSRCLKEPRPANVPQPPFLEEFKPVECSPLKILENPGPRLDTHYLGCLNLLPLNNTRFNPRGRNLPNLSEMTNLALYTTGADIIRAAGLFLMGLLCVSLLK